MKKDDIDGNQQIYFVFLLQFLTRLAHLIPPESRRVNQINSLTESSCHFGLIVQKLDVDGRQRFVLVILTNLGTLDDLFLNPFTEKQPKKKNISNEK